MGRRRTGKTFRFNPGLMFPEVGDAIQRRARELGMTQTDYVSELVARDDGADSVAELREREGLAASA